MRDDRRNYVIVGAFVLAMMVSLILWIGLVSGRTGPTNDYHILYRNVMGLKTGFEILYEGYPVGHIETIEPAEKDGQTVYKVGVTVRRGWEIPEDTVAAIVAPGLLSAFVIDMKAGKSPTLLPPGSEIPSAEAENVMAAVGELAGSVTEVINNKVRPLLEEIAKTTPEIMGNLKEASEALNTSMERVQTLLGKENMGRVANILENVESATTDINTLTASLGETRGRVDHLILRVDAMLQEDEGELGRAVSDLRHTLDAVARHIDSITQNLDTTSRNMNEFSRHLRENPGVLLRGREADSGP